MKIVIVNPPSAGGLGFVREGRCEQRLSSFQYVMVPISLPSIAALLRSKGFGAEVIDAIAENIPTDVLVDRLSKDPPGLVIVNFSTVTYEADRAFVSSLRRSYKGHITAIGVHVTALPERTLMESELDSVVRAEPEMTCLELAKALENNSRLATIDGLSFKADSKVVHNKQRDFIEDLDSLPFPARDLIDNYKYTLPIVNKPYTLLISSRGCPYNCIYCTAHMYYGRKLRMRSAESIVDEVEEVVKKHGVSYITMWSDTFTLNRDFVVKVCNGIISKNIKVNWMCNGRVDKVDKDLLVLMKRSGCMGISYGVESGVQKILDNVRKDITLDQIRQAFKWTREAGIESLAHIIFGLPGETLSTIDETIKFVLEIDPDYAQFYCAVPFPGTEYYRIASDKGWIKSAGWDQYELNQAIVSTDTLSLDELKKARVKAYRKFYLRPGYIVGRLVRIKSYTDLVLTARQARKFLSEWVG